MRPRPQSATLASRAAKDVNSNVTSAKLNVKQPTAPVVRPPSATLKSASKATTAPSSAAPAPSVGKLKEKSITTAPQQQEVAFSEAVAEERRALVKQFLEKKEAIVSVVSSSPVPARKTSPIGQRSSASFRTYGVVPRDAARHSDVSRSEPTELPPPPAIVTAIPRAQQKQRDLDVSVDEMNTSTDSAASAPPLPPATSVVIPTDWLNVMERRNSGRYVQHFSPTGFYKCARCATPLFSAKSKIRGLSGGYAAFKAHYVPSLELALDVHGSTAPSLGAMMLAVQRAPSLSMRCTNCKLFVGTAPLDKQHEATDVVLANSSAIQFVDQTPPPAFAAVEGSLLNHGADFDDEDDDEAPRQALRRASQVPSFGSIRRTKGTSSPRPAPHGGPEDMDEDEDAADGNLWSEMRSARKAHR